MKTKIYSLLLILFFTSILIYAHSTGITQRTRKTTTVGCDCHSSTPSSGVNVSITGPDTLAPGQNAIYTVTIIGGPLVAAGTNISASSGILSVISDQGLQLLNGELTHITPKTPSAGSVSFQFNYQAPSNIGSITLFANGNSVNFNGQSTGDQWNFAPDKTIFIANTTTGINDNKLISDYRLNQNYPNPFNPSTEISFSLKKGSFVKLIVYNEIGKEVSVLINDFKNEGNYSVNFNAANLSSGIYYYKIVTAEFNETKKMLLLK